MSGSELTSILADLVRIPSRNPPGEEKAIGEYFVSKFEGLDCEVVVQEVAQDRSNVIVTIDRGGSGPRILLNGHMDTVGISGPDRWKTDPFSAVLSKGRIFGLGAADMKGGLAAMIWAGRRLAGSLRRGKLVLSFVVDEEIFDRGSVTLAKSKHVKGLDSCIVMEPTGMQVAIAQRGFVDLQVEVFGKSAHASMPGGGLNAITKMSKMIATNLESYSKQLRKSSHPLLGPGTVNVGYIHGGKDVQIASVVPEYCKVYLERRFLPSENADGVFRETRESLERGSRDEGYRLRVKKLFRMPSMETDINAPIVKDLVERVKHVLGKEPSVVGFPGYSEAEIFSRVAGIDSVVFGPGDLGLAHAPDESVKIEEVEGAAQVLLHLFSRDSS